MEGQRQTQHHEEGEVNSHLALGRDLGLFKSHLRRFPFCHRGTRVPPVLIHFSRVVNYKPIQLLVIPIFGNLHMFDTCVKKTKCVGGHTIPGHFMTKRVGYCVV